MMKKPVLFSLLLMVPFLIFGQAKLIKTVEFTWISDSEGNLTCEESVSNPKLLKQSQIEEITRNLRIIPSTLTSAGGSGNLNIILRATAQLEANQAALNSFVSAAEAWEKIILNPVTVVIDVDYGPLRFGTAYSSANVIGSTSSAIYAATTGGSGTGNTVNFTEFGERLTGIHEGFSTLYSSIPDPLKTDIGTVTFPIATRPNLQALGYFPEITPEETPFGQTPNIGFNSAFAFDFDQSNGISSTLTDFQGVTIHEIGHALGFVSSIGYSDGYCTVWDIFRFRPGAVKNFEDFYLADRVLSPGPLVSGGDQVFWDGAAEFEVSTGASNGTGGDTRQASHWRDDALRGTIPLSERKIGVMDPTFGRGELGQISRNDLRLLSIIGWNIDHGNKISPPLRLNAYSDYKSPENMVLTWENPEAFYDGRFVSDWKVVVQRNNTDVKVYDSPLPSELVEFSESGLTPGVLYTYRVFPIHTLSGDTGISSVFSRYAGGSLTPAAPTVVTGITNGTTAIFTVKAATLHDDQTPMHNLKGFIVNRSRDKVDLTGELSPADTGKVFQFIDTAPVGSAFPTRYSFSFVGKGDSNMVGPSLISDIFRLGTPLTSLNETFETETPKVIGTSGWTVSKESFMTSKAIGITSFIPGSFQSAFLAAIKAGKSQQVSFQTIARLNPSQANGLVELSIDNGKTWTVVKTLNSDSHADWANGLNTWVKESVSLTAYEGKNVILRFRLEVTGSEGSSGWYLDELVLETFTDVAETQTVKTFSLEPNYPNPFNPSTRIVYTLPAQSKVTLKVMNILGQDLVTLVDEVKPAGRNEITFDASSFPSGIYFYRISAAGQTQTRKMILSK